MKNNEWNNLRAKLHHDWLQNRYLTFLKSWKDCFDDVEACGQEREDVLEQLLQWENKRNAFKRLIDNSEEALSPKQLLYEPPLNRMTEENKEWLGEVIHALFFARTGIKNKILELRAKMDEIDKIVDTIARVLRVEAKSTDSTGEKIISTFIEFSREISDLPHEIQVV